MICSMSFSIDLCDKKDNGKELNSPMNKNMTCGIINRLNGKEQDILVQLNEHGINIFAQSKIKRRETGAITYPDYAFIYIEKERYTQVTTGVGTLIKTYCS